MAERQIGHQNRVWSFPRAFPSSTDIPVLLLNLFLFNLLIYWRFRPFFKILQLLGKICFDCIFTHTVEQEKVISVFKNIGLQKYCAHLKS